MRERQRSLVLILIMSAVAVGVGAVILVVLYNVELNSQRARLTEAAQSQARLIEAVARHEKLEEEFSRQDPEGYAFQVVMDQLKEAHERFDGFGETGEFALARREGNQIIFLLSHRHAELADPQPVPFSGRRAEPMRRALSGDSGTIVALDYRGRVVLAAHEPVSEFALGIVAKIDLSEVRAPFFRGGLWGGGVACVLILFGAVSFRRIINPMIETLHRAEVVVDISTDMLALLDRDFIYLAANPVYLKAFGLTRDLLVGRTVADVFGEAFFQTVIKPHADRSLAGEEVRYEAWFDFPVAGRRYMEVTYSPYTRAGQHVEGIAVNARDGTQRKHAEDQLATLHQELEQRVQDRTAELEATNRDLEAFAYSVSHDLRAPLRAMDGFSRILLEDHGTQLDAQGADYLGRVRAGAQRMGRRIDALLGLSTIATRELRPRPIDLAKIAGGVATRLREAAPERQVEFVIPKTLPATGDADLLEAALDNLLENAWKFTANQVAARIELGLTERDGRPVYYIRDNGAGFDMAYADKLFQPFRRLHREDEFPGVGVGLANVERIVRRHGGDIWAEAEVGRGATFYFTLGAQPTGILSDDHTEHRAGE